MLLTRALFVGPCYCSYIFVPYLAFRVHVAGDTSKTISFAADVLSTSFAGALLGFIRYNEFAVKQLRRSFVIRYQGRAVNALYLHIKAALLSLYLIAHTKLMFL